MRIRRLFLRAHQFIFPVPARAVVYPVLLRALDRVKRQFDARRRQFRLRVPLRYFLRIARRQHGQRRRKQQYDAQADRRSLSSHSFSPFSVFRKAFFSRKKRDKNFSIFYHKFRHKSIEKAQTSVEICIFFCYIAVLYMRFLLKRKKRRAERSARRGKCILYYFPGHAPGGRRGHCFFPFPYSAASFSKAGRARRMVSGATQ